MLRAKSWLLLGGALLALALVGLLLGWGVRALAERFAPAVSVAPLPTDMAIPTPTLEATQMPSPGVTEPTSTLAPEGKITVALGESLYAVCRRYCPANWGAGALDDALRQYSEDVANRNALEWVEAIKGYVIIPGQVLDMPPCPPR